MCDHQTDPSICWWEYDVKGIALCKVCPACVKAKLSGYRPSVLSDEQQMTAFGKVVTTTPYEGVEEQVEADY